MNCLIISNGTPLNRSTFEKLYIEADYIICVDGGSHMAYDYHILPNLIIGDLDSIKPATLQYFKEKNVPFQQFPAEKDDTDTRIAVNYALKNGATHLVLIGCTGSRLDHTLGNISLLTYIHRQGVTATIIDNHNEIMLMEHTLSLQGKPGDIVSLLPITECVEGITLSGFKYPLENAIMVWGNPYGISNELIEKEGRITIKKGFLLVIKSKD